MSGLAMFGYMLRPPMPPAYKNLRYNNNLFHNIASVITEL
jgi:hypothetical protein